MLLTIKWYSIGNRFTTFKLSHPDISPSSPLLPIDGRQAGGRASKKSCTFIWLCIYANFLCEQHKQNRPNWLQTHTQKWFMPSISLGTKLILWLARTNRTATQKFAAAVVVAGIKENKNEVYNRMTDRCYISHSPLFKLRHFNLRHEFCVRAFSSSHFTSKCIHFILVFFFL